MRGTYLLAVRQVSQTTQHSWSCLSCRGQVTAAILLAVLMLVGFKTLPVAAQEGVADTTPTSVDKDAMNVLILPPFVFTSPPLPKTEPRLGPPVAALTTESVTDPQLPLAPDDGLVGWTGYGYGSSTIGSGLEILSNSDDMDLRSTAIDLGLIQSSDQFVMPNVAADERWIRVDLGNQQVVAYEGQHPQRAFIVSTGLPIYQTVTGEFRIRMKVSEQTMSGDDFYLPGVKWVQYFYSEYAFHGTYWHSDFGIPKSHGCVNMTNADAKWLFDWAGPTWDEETVWFRSTEDNPGTLVIVHQ